MRIFLSILLLTTCLHLYANQGDDVQKRVYITQAINEAPVIDGKLEDACWNEGVWDGNFRQQIPNSGMEPSQQTEIKVLYDAENIYVAIKSLDTEPDKIRQIFGRRDEFAGDVVGIAFDSYHDLRTAFEFNVTAAGQKVDLKHSGDGDHDKNWNAIWDAATAITSDGWVVEMRIPFSQLRYNIGEQKVWGMHVWRWIDRYREESQWQLIPQEAPAMVYLFGELKGIENIRSSRQVELMPYASASLEYNGDQENPYLDNWQKGANAGVDAKIGISSNFTLDATINPDFGQVEADPSELNLSSFETFFREKRPFFLEGSEIFDYRIDRDRLFYTRRIGSKPGFSPDIDDDEYADLSKNTTILGSVKLTGRTAKGLSLGLMNSLTAKEFGKIYSPDDTRKVVIEPLSNYFAGRVKQELNNANTIIGASINSVFRNNNEQVLKDNFTNSAITGGVDFTQYFGNRNYFLTGKLAASYVSGSQNSIWDIQQSHLHRFNRPDTEHLDPDSTKTSLSGVGGTIRMGKQGGQFKYGAKVGFWSPEFNINDIGYARVADKIEQQAWIEYESIESKGFFRKYSFEFDNKISSSFGGEITDNEFGLESSLHFQNLWTSHFKGILVLPSFDTRKLRGGPALMQEAYAGIRGRISSNRSKRLSASAEGGFWHSIKTPTTYYEYGLGLHYNPINQLTLGLDVSFERNFENYQYITSIEEENTDKMTYLLGTMDRNNLYTTLRVEYYLSPELTIQYYGSPYFSVGSFSDFKRVDKPDSKDFNERYHYYGKEEYSFDSENNEYSFSETGNEDFSISNPDFSFAQFRSNLILRWEYKLGSVFYLVWAHEQTINGDNNMPELSDSFGDLFSTSPNDIILMKFSYWFSI